MLLLRKAAWKPHDVVTAYGTVVPSTITKLMKEYEIISKQRGSSSPVKEQQIGKQRLTKYAVDKAEDI